VSGEEVRSSAEPPLVAMFVCRQVWNTVLALQIHDVSGRCHAEQAQVYPHGYSSLLLKEFNKLLCQYLE